MNLPQWLQRVAAACLLAFAAAPSAAESLASVEAGTLPALASHGAPTALVSVGQRPVAIGTAGAFALDTERKAWSPLAWHSPALVQSAFGNGDAAFVMTGAQPQQAERIARLQLVGDRLQAQPLPSLPSALRDAQATFADGIVTIAGQDDRTGETVLLKFDTASPTPAWTPGPAGLPAGRITSLVSQRGQLLATIATNAGPDRLWRWSTDHGWQALADVPGTIEPAAARAMGQAHVLYLVRDRNAPDAAPSMMTFQIIVQAWATLPGRGVPGPALTASWRDGVVQVAPSGEGATASFVQVQARKLLLSWLDWAVIVVYLASMIGIGLYFYLREKRKSTSDFFVGGRSIPFWAAGVSLYAANTSSISFIAIPAKAFETNWQYMTNNLIAVLGLVFVAIVIVPLLRRLNLMSVFSYLETRFHPSIRMLASALCIVMQIGSRMSVILFLPALGISTITGIDVVWSVLLMGGFTIIYTAMGGMKAVIWTDFVQVIVKMGGAIFAIAFIVWHVKGGLPEFAQVAAAADKTKLLDFSFDLTKATVWGFIFLVIFDVVLTFPKDQVLMQRVLSTESDKEAGRSVWAFAAIMIPGGFIFYGIGTALFVYYQSHPERMNPLLPVDATFPLFIAAELPMGVTGLIIAGIFAAAMATLSGIMNSVATLISVDFYEKLAKNPTPKQSVVFAEVMTVVVGLIGIGAALLLARFDIHSLFDVSIELAGLLGGGFAGAYTLGMFTRRANSQGVAIGIAGSIALTMLCWSQDLVHPYFYLAISILLCIVIGYVASLFFPPPQRSLAGLTIYRRDQIKAGPVVAEGAAG